MKKRLMGVLAFSVLGVLAAQIVPQQQAPPLFKGEKKDKDRDSKTRSLNGIVYDQNGNPADAAIVQLKDTKSLQVRSFITKDDGGYRFYGLSKDVDYQVKAERKNEVSDVKTLSVFDSRKAAVINLKMDQKK
ncbi:MAG: hypothetical protein IANPNBLG_03207 [Bryobacteraceae bacterium]|nr:hypothetical protein [Bryobacteraceae bacterium]MCC6341372.1 carboxypeptidase regulatory-like domain-containing protein [Bryobacterales bacterium]